MKKFKPDTRFFFMVILLSAGIKLFAADFTYDDGPYSRFAPYFSGSGQYFKLNPVTDSILTASGTTLFITELNLQGIKQQKFDGTILNRDDINVLDRLAARPYSKPLDITGSVVLGAALAAPLMLAGTDNREWITILTMYAETMLISESSKELIKDFVYRPRPYMYFDGYPQEYVDSGDWDCSFPSGHTTMAFAAASFTSFVFCTYFPDSAWRFPVVIGSYSLAAATGILRLASGNHFITDVLAGAALGTVIGIGIPLLHRIDVGKTTDESRKKEVFSCMMIPGGITAVIRF
jgi:membrane-associated phospholipid phosphatase